MVIIVIGERNKSSLDRKVYVAMHGRMRVMYVPLHKKYIYGRALASMDILIKPWIYVQLQQILLFSQTTTANCLFSIMDEGNNC